MVFSALAPDALLYAWALDSAGALVAHAAVDLTAALAAHGCDTLAALGPRSALTPVRAYAAHRGTAFQVGATPPTGADAPPRCARIFSPADSMCRPPRGGARQPPPRGA